jgi:hypothetical protein
MRILLEFVDWKDWRPWFARSGDIRGSLAWSTVDDAGVHHVVVRRGAHRWLCGLQRVGHELEHALDPTFGNAQHHSWIHMCLRAYFPIRSWDHAKLASADLAKLLIVRGHLDDVQVKDGAVYVDLMEVK